MEGKASRIYFTFNWFVGRYPSSSSKDFWNFYLSESNSSEYILISNMISGYQWLAYMSFLNPDKEGTLPCFTKSFQLDYHTITLKLKGNNPTSWYLVSMNFKDKEHYCRAEHWLRLDKTRIENELNDVLQKPCVGAFLLPSNYEAPQKL